MWRQMRRRLRRAHAEADLELQVVGHEVREVAMAADGALELQGAGDGGAAPSASASASACAALGP